MLTQSPRPGAAARGPQPQPANPCEETRSRIPSRIQIDPDNVAGGLVQLVLTVVELLRELLERQAIRRIDGGSLSSEEIERLGLTFMRMSEEMDRLKELYGLNNDDLNLNLGPLGNLR